MHGVHYDTMKLATWMKTNNWDDNTLALKVGVNTSTINRLRRGMNRPSWKVAVLIERVSKGAVTVADFIKQ